MAKTFVTRLYPPFGKLADLFESSPLDLSFRDSLALSSRLFDEADIETQSRRIAALGAKLESNAILFGKTWVGKAIDQDVATLSNLRKVQVDILQNFDYIIEEPMLKKKQLELRDLHDNIQKELDRVKSQQFCVRVAFCGMVKAGYVQLHCSITVK